MLGEEIRDGLDDRPREEHPGLGSVHSDVREDRLELGPDEVGRRLVHGRHAHGALGGESDDGTHPEATGACEGLEIRLDSGAAAGVGACDRQTARDGHEPLDASIDSTPPHQ